MSAPDTNIEKQKARHKGPLLGMGAVVVFALILFLGFVAYVFFNGQDPDETLGTRAVPAEIAAA